MSYAEDTSVSVEKTRAELETVLRKHGADAFGYATDSGRASIQFRFKGKYVRFLLLLPNPEDKKFTRHARYDWQKRTPEAALKLWEQACRAAWRALFLAVKAKLVAVEAGISTFEEEFLARIILPDGSTVGDRALPAVEEAYRTGEMPTFTLALPASSNHEHRT